MIHEYSYIKQRLNEIQTFLESPYDCEPEILLDRLATLDAMNAEAGKLKADAEYWLDKKLSDEIFVKIKDLGREFMTATLLNKWVKTLAYEEQHTATFADRINRTCVHQIESMRTQISYLKNYLNTNK